MPIGYCYLRCRWSFLSFGTDWFICVVCCISSNLSIIQLLSITVRLSLLEFLIFWLFVLGEGFNLTHKVLTHNFYMCITLFGDALKFLNYLGLFIIMRECKDRIFLYYQNYRIRVCYRKRLLHQFRFHHTEKEIHLNQPCLNFSRKFHIHIWPLH